MSRFDRDTEVEALGDGRFRARLDRAWWVLRGPNGGYVAALIARAIRAGAGDDGRALRSLTVHFLAAPVEGEAEVAVRVERAGRATSFVSARCEQGGRPVALALAALSTGYPPGIEYAHARMPDVAPPEALDALAPWGGGPVPPFAQRFELRPALGPPPFSGADRALSAGWVRFREPRPLDELALVALCDSWWPSLYAVADRFLAAPTIDLTVHLRAPLVREHDDVLVDVRSDTARDGFFEEDARIFARDGTLLAQSRQLALAV